MALKKSELYSSIWRSCDELRGGMDASQYKDYVLVLLFIKYVSDKYAGKPFAEVEVPPGATFADMVALKGDPEIGDKINHQILGPLKQKNGLADVPDFNDPNKLGQGKEMVERLTNLIAIFEDPALDFSKNRADGDDLLGDAYEYLMRHFATESGKSKGQFYTPAEVSRVIAKVLGIRGDETSAKTTVYDPTCGSGSLLLKVADEARTDVTLEGQEKDSATSGLARMNLILHHHPEAEIAQGNTLAHPRFLRDDGSLKTYDYVVANPPFSDKRWRTGIDPDNDPHRRFAGFGVPPEKQGDFAYLLHIVRSLKGTGRGACILPHGVLFRGHAEETIRRALIQKKYIEAVIGLPANLFYGTGIPACIVVIDKRSAHQREGLFMIDAGAGFIKDGPKNRLREMDIHRIVDVFAKKREVAGFSRFVPLAEIEKNDFNLNLPRYIDSQAAEDLQDIDAHLRGGLPNADLDALHRFWQVCPGLRADLFEPEREGYSRLTVPPAEIQDAILGHPEFAAFSEEMTELFESWSRDVASRWKALVPGFRPKELIEQESEDLLALYRGRALIDPYAVYQHLMDYWAATMQDDCYLISADGWVATTERIIEVDKKGREKDKGWTCDLIPKPLMVARFFAGEQAELDGLAAEIDETSAQMEELQEAHGSEDGVLHGVSKKSEALEAWSTALESYWDKHCREDYFDYCANRESIQGHLRRRADLESSPLLGNVKNAKGKATLGAINKRLKGLAPSTAEAGALEEFRSSSKDLRLARRAVKEARQRIEETVSQNLSENPEEGNLEELRLLKEWLDLDSRRTQLRQKRKTADLVLDLATYERYPRLVEKEVRALVVDDKWLATLRAAVLGETDRVSLQLTQRVTELAERYETPLPQLTERVADLEAKVSGHLERMGFSWM